MKVQELFYTTQNEITFIKRLGTYSQSAAVQMKSRAVLLKQYINAALRRFDWGEINADVCIDFAYSELAKELKKRG